MRIMAQLVAAAWLAAAGLDCSARAQDFDPARVVGAVDQTDLLAVVAARGDTVREVGKGGETFVSAETPDGIVYLLFGTACNVDGVAGCQGIMMQVRYDLPLGTTPETLARANREEGAVNTIADFEQKTLLFMRYHVLDEGVTLGNIRANINVLMAVLGSAYPIAAGEADRP